MIKINLKSSGKQANSGQPEFVANLDFSGFNLKIILVCGLLGFGPKWVYFDDLWNEELGVLKAEAQEVEIKTKKLQEKERSMAGYAKQLESLKFKEQALRERLGVVNKVMENKNNPMKIMLYVAEHIPEDVWINDMTIDGKNFKLNGYAISYKSIGIFINNLKTSIFFNQQVNLEDYISKEIDGIRVQEFFLKANIDKFE